MDTGENQQSLRAIIDFVRMGSIILLCLHFYVYCYNAFEIWGLTADLPKRIITGFADTGLFSNFYNTKLFALGLLFVSLVGSRGKKEESIKPASIIVFLLTGTALYFSSALLFYLHLSTSITAMLYILATTAGYILLLTGGGRLSRTIQLNLQKDIFNEDNESFPQEERLLVNEYSINLEGAYRFKGKTRKMFVNLINPFRATMIVGGPG
ncbi:YWFCY domain-containing protein [Chitinophaga sp. CC14]|uniref:YWFCY domain-containing protein n=1 Tax=Chitinophaga sp. CC14 TaxID=3029199 RepID=UPI003B76B5C1